SRFGSPKSARTLGTLEWRATRGIIRHPLPPPSVRPTTRLLDHGVPPRKVPLDHAGDLSWRSRHRIDALRAELLPNVGLRLHTRDLGAQLVDDALRRARRGGQRGPGFALVPGAPRLR